MTLAKFWAGEADRPLFVTRNPPSLNSTYSRVRVGKHLSDMFVIRNGLKEGDAVSLLLLNFTLEYAIKRVQVNQYGLKLNGTHQLYAYDVNTRYIGRKRTFYKEKECACTILSSEASPTLLYFTLYLINSMIIKKVIKNGCFGFLYNFCLKHVSF